MTEDLEAPYVFQAKKQEAFESLQAAKEESLWDSLQSKDGAKQFYLDNEPLEFFDFVIMQIAETRDEMLNWKHPMLMATKAACYDRIEAALCILIEEDAKRQAEKNINAPKDKDYE